MIVDVGRTDQQRVVLQARQQGRSTAAHKLECEARHWLREGYSTPGKVDELMQRIRAHRGAEAADQLRQEMRRQWERRAEWMAPPE